MSTSRIDAEKAKEIVESIIVLPQIQPGAMYSRIQDDHDGTFLGSIAAGIGRDGDAYIGMGDRVPIRFRNLFVGGDSLRTHTAILLLIEAIRLDNEDHPQVKPVESGWTGRLSIPMPQTAPWLPVTNEPVPSLDAVVSFVGPFLVTNGQQYGIARFDTLAGSYTPRGWHMIGTASFEAAEIIYWHSQTLPAIPAVPES